MDLSNVDMNALAQQLRKPEGDFGVQVGEVMAKNTEFLNMFAVQYLAVRPTDRVLEIGYGPGVAVAALADLTPDGFVYGIDHSPDMLDMAEARNRRAIMEERMELTVGSARELPYDDKSVDKILCVNVFHFWPDPTPELAECLRVLKPGGTALFYVTHPAFWPKGLAESGVFTAREPQEMEALLQQAGFASVQHRVQTTEGFKGFAVLGVK